MLTLKPDARLIDVALDLGALGYSVFPLSPKTKIPPKGLSWTPNVKRAMTPDEIRAHWTKYPEDNIALICCRLSNLTVVDLDPKGAPQAHVEAALAFLTTQRMNPSPVVRTGSGGAHVYFASAPIRTSIKTPAHKIIPGLPADSPLMIDIKSEPSYVVAPHSIHPNGTRYVIDPAHPFVPSMDLPQLPIAMLQCVKLTSAPARTQQEWKDIVEGSSEGSRNSDSVALGGLLFHHLPPQYWEDVVKPLLRLWNTHLVTPSLPQSQLETTLRWLEAKEAARFEV